MDVTVVGLSCRARYLLDLPLQGDIWPPLENRDALDIARKLDAKEYKEQRPQPSRLKKLLQKLGFKKDRIQPFSPWVHADLKSCPQVGLAQTKRASFESAVYAAWEANAELCFKRNDGVSLSIRPRQAVPVSGAAALANN